MMLPTVVAAIIFLILAYGYFAERFWIRKTKIAFGNYFNIKFAHLSDIHFSRESIREKKILEILQEESIDLIFITGDIVNYRKKFVGYDYLKKIVELRKPVYFVFGNWDYKVKDLNKLRTDLKNLHIIVLEDEHVIYEKDNIKINIVGISDPYTKRANLVKAVKGIDKSLYTILLSHSPDIFYEGRDEGINLILSGHMHGGQIKLPFVKFALYAPSKYGSRFLYGLFKEKNTTMYVNKGIGESHFPIRICAKPEILIGKI
ncbi:metallophosphoesterase [Caldisericum exile]|uniref:Hydrolase n=1 Tax=Caldisericum exile (strain DSM 21853 / NBRC 104410 / AZM16c01) TaxID=511051 RepID=A0A7U6JFW0_CALEA|nr:metallophosphoesterase [Caldisericum exile]BAL80675.1 putative hydrolase [Caldisericum exile AZM16c01]